ncbi:hypothetical protein JVX90_07160 [Gordonia sp. PDNC005]|uniref:hypothetical protein n=1 Tax=unclassified Gordonia (in: high G+C Gram-positive bacteria) TaxID=2657482 RepID=UPI0019641501|nr:hypothetical protein [Gordonia sp. PDNC005]QRY63968.1 hypothetical protein JVX90_07160 [Gordonia sp. PDNC005]
MSPFDSLRSLKEQWDARAQGEVGRPRSKNSGTPALKEQWGLPVERAKRVEAP